MHINPIPFCQRSDERAVRMSVGESGSRTPTDASGPPEDSGSNLSESYVPPDSRRRRSSASRRCSTDSLLAHPGGDYVLGIKAKEKKVRRSRHRRFLADDPREDHEQAVLLQQLPSGRRRGRSTASREPSDPDEPFEPELSQSPEPLRIHISRSASPAGKRSARSPPAIHITIDNDTSVSISETSDDDGLPKRRGLEGTGTVPTRRATNVSSTGDKRVTFEGWANSVSERDVPLRKTRRQQRREDNRDEGTLSITSTEECEIAGRNDAVAVYDEGPRWRQDNYELDDEEAGLGELSLDSPPPTGRGTSIGVLSASELPTEEYQLITPSSVIVITKTGDIIAEDSVSDDIAEGQPSDIPRADRSADTSRPTRLYRSREEGDTKRRTIRSKKPVVKASVRPVQASGPQGPIVGSRFYWSVTDASQEPFLPAPQELNDAKALYEAQDVEDLGPRSLGSWDARNARASRYRSRSMSPASSRQMPIRYLRPRYASKRCRRHSRERSLALSDMAEYYRSSDAPPSRIAEDQWAPPHEPSYTYSRDMDYFPGASPAELGSLRPPRSEDSGWTPQPEGRTFSSGTEGALWTPSFDTRTFLSKVEEDPRTLAVESRGTMVESWMPHSEPDTLYFHEDRELPHSTPLESKRLGGDMRPSVSPPLERSTRRSRSSVRRSRRGHCSRKSRDSMAQSMDRRSRPSSRITDPSRTPSFMSQVPEEPAFHIRITARRPRSKSKPVDSSSQVVDLPPEGRKRKKKTTFVLHCGTPPVGLYDDEEHVPKLADPVLTYLYHSYEVRGRRSRKARSRDSKRSSALGWHQKPRRSFSLGTVTKCVGSVADEEVSLESTAAMLQESRIARASKQRKPVGGKVSCPLPTATAQDRNDGALEKTGYPCAELYALSADTEAQSGGQESPLIPCIRSRPHVKRIVVNRRLIAYPSLAVMAVTVTVGIAVMLLSDTARKFVIAADRNNTDHVITRSISGIGGVAIEEDIETCETSSCRRDGVYLKGLLSWELDPCDDFYRFVCRQWKSTTHGGTTETEDISASAYGDLTDMFESRMLTLLQRTGFSESLSQLKAVFQECMNTEQLDIDGWSHMTELFWLATLEGFPYNGTSVNNSSVWKVAARLLRMTGTEALLSIRTTDHPYKTHESIITIGTPSTLSPAPNDVEETTAFYNKSAYAAVAALNGTGNYSALSLQVASFAARLEALASSHRISPRPRGPNTLKAIPELLTFALEVFTIGDTPAFAGAATEVMIDSPEYISGLLNLVNDTDPSFVLNYLGVRLMIEMSAFAPRAGQELVNALVHRLYGKPRPSLPRWRLCVRVAEIATPYLFLHAARLAHEDTFAIKSIRSHVKVILKHLASSLDNFAVLDDTTRLQALTALNKTRISIFRPSWVDEAGRLSAYLDELPQVVHGQSLRSFYMLRSHSFSLSLRQDREDHWLGSAFDTDCSMEGYTLYLPVLMFNFTLLHFDEDESFQLPHAGVKILRCLLQMISRGFKLSKVKEVEQRPDIGHPLVRRTQLCFEKYGVRGVDPSVLMERTAALQMALYLYLKEKKFDKRFGTLRGYGVQRLFFVYYALGYCEEHRGGNASRSLSVATALVNVPLWNNRAFHETFRCVVGTRMNPRKTCPVWHERY